MVVTRKFLIVMLFIFVTAFMLVACGDNNSSGAVNTNDGENNNEEKSAGMDPITLSFADFFPTTHRMHSEVLIEWAEAVHEATDGLVTIEMYPGGTLLGNGDIYAGVESGTADIGHDVAGYNPGRLPVLNSLYLGGIDFPNSAVSSRVARDLIEIVDPVELQDTEVMFVYGPAPGVLATNEPIRTMEDLRGTQIRASGTNVDTLEALGATPVSIPISETYEAQSRGIVDGSLLPVELLKGYNLGEVTKYVTEADFIYNGVNYVTMNKDVWNSFPSDIQEKIREVNEEYFYVAIDVFTSIIEEGTKYAVEEHGIEVINLSEEEEKRWRDTLAPLIDEQTENLNSSGLDGQLIMDTIVELSEKYTQEFGE